MASNCHKMKPSVLPFVSSVPNQETPPHPVNGEGVFPPVNGGIRGGCRFGIRDLISETRY